MGYFKSEPKSALGFSLPIAKVYARKRREKRLILVALGSAVSLIFIITLTLLGKVSSGTTTSVAKLPATSFVSPISPIEKMSQAPLAVKLPDQDLALRAGMRAISLQVDATSGLEGHALAGSNVDVTLTSTRSGQASTSVIVENARVLSYGGDTRGANEQEVAAFRTAPLISKTITLEVKPFDALQIENARQLGRLGLLMRAPGDIEQVERTEISANDLGENKKGKLDTKRCTKGRVTFNGESIIVGCDGEISKVE